MKDDYWYWNNYLSLDDRKLVIDYIDNNYDFYEDKSWFNSNIKNTDDVKCISWNNINKLNVINKMIDEVLTVNQKNFGYNIYPLRTHNPFNLTVYSSSKKASYDWHRDQSIDNLLDIKLTGILNLSTEVYEGGEFLFNRGVESVVPQFAKGGDMILFKSHILHKVSPVTKGTRKTLTFFLEGPRFV